jgi:hypothetical protein
MADFDLGAAGDPVPGAQNAESTTLEALLVRKFCDPLERLLAVDGELP